MGVVSCLVLLFVLLSFGAVPGAQAADLDMVEAYDLWASSILTGKVHVIISPAALLIENKQTGCNLLVSSAFKDGAYVYSVSKKIYARTTSEKFRNPMTRSITWFNTRALSDIPVIKLGEKKFLDRPAIYYGSTMKYVAQIRAGHKRGEVPGRTPCELDFRTCKEFRTSEDFERFADRYFDLPYVPGFPLYLLYKDAAGDPKTYFEIKKVSKLKVNKSLFVLPLGLKPVDKYEEVMGAEDLQEFF